MKLTIQIKLSPDQPTSAKLLSTMERFNEACNWIAGQLFDAKLTNKVEAQKLLYREVRNLFGLSSQMAIHCIHVVCGVYKCDTSIKPTFRPHAAVVYDQRSMSFKGDALVSLLTLDGRVKVPFVLGNYQKQHWHLPKGQCDLVLKEGEWFLLVSVEVPEATPILVTDFIGVDLGIVNLAVTSDGDTFTGDDVEKVRKKHTKQRRALQRRNTRGAKKKLRRLAGKEARFRRHTNHIISKRIVDIAKRTGRGIVLENLLHIRDRVTAHGSINKERLSGWAFAQLDSFIDYKSKRDGVPVIYIDPRNTSRTCSQCGYCDKANRKSQSLFLCKRCDFRSHADRNAALNIKFKALGVFRPPIELVAVTHTVSGS